MSNAFGNQGFIQKMIDESRGKSRTPHSARPAIARKQSQAKIVDDVLYKKYSGEQQAPKTLQPGKRSILKPRYRPNARPTMG